MKVKKIGALCKEAGKCLLFDELSREGEIVRQWICNGYAMWPVSGLPQLREANLSTLFDFTANATEKIYIKEIELPEALYAVLYDLRDGERELTESTVRIKVDGKEIMALTAGEDVIWLNTKLLAPCWTKETQLVARGERVAVLDGLFLAGIIMPYNVQPDTFRELLRLGTSAKTPVLPPVEPPEDEGEDDAD